MSPKSRVFFLRPPGVRTQRPTRPFCQTGRRTMTYWGFVGILHFQKSFLWPTEFVFHY